MPSDDQVHRILQHEREQLISGEDNDEKIAERFPQILDAQEDSRVQASEYERGQADNARFPFAPSNRITNQQDSMHSSDGSELQVVSSPTKLSL